MFTHKHRKPTVYGAFAVGVNVYLSVHSDEDFVTCATSIHVMRQYILEENPVVYFTFPCLGKCVAMMPGDILFFNPKEPHTVSSRILDKENIFCLSLYLKSKHMGLNDNGTYLNHFEKWLMISYQQV